MELTYLMLLMLSVEDIILQLGHNNMGILGIILGEQMIMDNWEQAHSKVKNIHNKYNHSRVKILSRLQQEAVLHYFQTRKEKYMVVEIIKMEIQAQEMIISLKYQKTLNNNNKIMKNR